MGGYGTEALVMDMVPICGVMALLDMVTTTNTTPIGHGVSEEIDSSEETDLVATENSILEEVDSSEGANLAMDQLISEEIDSLDDADLADLATVENSDASVNSVSDVVIDLDASVNSV